MGNPNWTKGISGNPRGRPKADYTLAAEAKKHTKKALQALVEIVSDRESPQRVSAARELLDRGWGKSPLVLAGAGGVGPAELTITWTEEPAAPDA